MAKPVYTDEQAINQLIDRKKSTNGIQSAKWGSNSYGTGATITYSYLGSTQTIDRTFEDDELVEQNLSLAEIAQFEQYIQLIEDVANVNLVRVGRGNYSDQGDIKIQKNTSGWGLGSTSITSRAGPDLITWGLVTLRNNFSQRHSIHEVLHVLGLSHPGPYNGSGHNYEDDAVYYQDTSMYTLMSYFGGTNSGASYNRPGELTLMIHDVMAIQYLYSANNNAFSGNTVYGFNSNTNRDPWTVTSNADNIFGSIWDTGGIDTIDTSGYSANGTIRLTQGKFSSLNGETFNLSIVPGTVIENAIGGSGNDNIYGNSANNLLQGRDGNDYIFGDIGHDSLWGEDGNDRLYASGGNDYVRGGNGNDKLNGWYGNDRLYGDAGKDTLEGSYDDDYLSGGSDNDNLDGGHGNDTMLGGSGNDYLFGDIGHDSLWGEDGDDRLYASGGNDYVRGGNGNDKLNGWYGNDHLYGDAEKDTLEGSYGDDSLDGGSNDDLVFGNDGNDYLYGSSGNDFLSGGNGKDILNGVNIFAPSPGVGEVDTLTGGSGSDTFVLGDSDKIYYDDGIWIAPFPGTTSPPEGYGLITDFQAGQDTIELKGGVDYDLANVDLGGGVSGRGIYVDNPGLDDELVGIIQGVNQFTPLQINNGLSITTITGLGFELALM